MIVNNIHTLETLNNERAGVIVYTIRNDELYFLLGIDRKTRELTDFGGGCKNKNNETLVDSAWREFCEESCGIFLKDIKKEKLYSSIAVTNVSRNTAIFFVRVSEDWVENAVKIFKDTQLFLKQLAINTESEEENISVKWVREPHFKEIAFNRKNQCMWSRIQCFLMRNVEYDELKKSLV